MNLGIGGMASIKLIGDHTSDVRYTGEAIDFPIDLDWGEIENYGTDSGAGDYLLNRDGSRD